MAEQPTDQAAGATCCGEHDYSPGAGKPLVIGCAMCPRSFTYWRLPPNRADGKPYEPTPPLGAGGYVQT